MSRLNNKEINLLSLMPPWLVVAYREALRLSGRNPITSRGLRNIVSYYYHGFGAGYVQYSNWCAAFVSYCFKKSGFLFTDFKGTACSQDFLYDSEFIKIENPVFGCIAIWTDRKESRFGHVGFPVGVGKSNDDKLFEKSLIVLGGNQGNTIKFSIFPGPESEKKDNDLVFSCFLFPAAFFNGNTFSHIKKMSKEELIVNNHKINPLLQSDIKDRTTLIVNKS